MYGTVLPVSRTCTSTESPRVSSATPSSPTHGVVPTAPVARACASRALELLRWGVSRDICEHLLERQFPGVPIEIRQSCVISTESAIRNYRSAFRWRPPVDLYRRSPGRASLGSRQIDSDGTSRLDASPSLLASPSVAHSTSEAVVAAVPLKASQESVAIPPSGRATILLSNPVSDEETADDVPFIAQVNESENTFGTEIVETGRSVTKKAPSAVSSQAQPLTVKSACTEKIPASLSSEPPSAAGNSAVVEAVRVATSKYTPKKSSGRGPVRREHKVLEPPKTSTSATGSPAESATPATTVESKERSSSTTSTSSRKSGAAGRGSTNSEPVYRGPLGASWTPPSFVGRPMESCGVTPPLRLPPPPYVGERLSTERSESWTSDWSARRRRHHNTEASGRVGHRPASAGHRSSESSRPSFQRGDGRGLADVRRQREQLEHDLARLREQERHLRSHHHP